MTFDQVKSVRNRLVLQAGVAELWPVTPCSKGKKHDLSDESCAWNPEATFNEVVRLTREKRRDDELQT